VGRNDRRSKGGIGFASDIFGAIFPSTVIAKKGIKKKIDLGGEVRGM